MNTIKGLVIITRFDYIEHKYGADSLKKLVKTISTSEENYEKQPIVGANKYPESTLARIDETLLNEYFNNDITKFREIGQWIADSIMSKYFNMYIEEKKPVEFMQQYARLRSHMIGTGTMYVQEYNHIKINIKIDYEQPVPESVRLSELGFIQTSLEMCGLVNLKISKEDCQTSQNNFICEYEFSFK